MLKTALIWFGKTVGQTIAQIIGALCLGAGIFLVIAGFISGLGHHSWEARTAIVLGGCVAFLIGFGFYKLSVGRNKSVLTVIGRMIDDILTGLLP